MRLYDSDKSINDLQSKDNINKVMKIFLSQFLNTRHIICPILNIDIKLNNKYLNTFMANNVDDFEHFNKYPCQK